MIAEAVNACLVNYLQTPFTVITTLALCFMASWQLSLIIFIGLPLIVFPIIFLAKKVKKISRLIQKNQEHFTHTLIDFLAGIQTVKVFAMEDFSLTKYREQNDEMAKLEKKSAKYDLMTRPVVHTLAMLFLATSILWGIYVLQMGVSEIFFYCGLLYVFYEPIKKFAEENSHIQRGIAAADRLYEVLSMEPDLQDRLDARPFETFEREIEFKDVWFKYNEEWILKGLSFKVKKGETVGIVGPTGAGKSTIVGLLPRLYDPNRGEILIDGIPLDQYRQKTLREKIAFVPQKPFLFVDTIANNISYGCPFTDEEIERAAKKAHADEFIEKLPERYHTVLNEAGKNLSGGQQQRLAIARSLVKNAPILILDEATSSLDPLSEQLIKKSIAELHGEMTQLIIAHRLTTIEDADRIIYIEEGQKVAEGTREQLLETSPQFKLLWEASKKKG